MSKKPNIRINKVYTRKGDSGKTNLIDKKNLLKSDLRVVCYGEVDELNSNLGFCISLLKKSILVEKTELFKSMKKIQNDLFNLGTILATKPEDMTPSMPRITDEDIKVLEGEIDKANKELPVLHSFVLPGGSKINAFLHLARTVCRRCERICCSLYEEEKIDKIVIAYLNRLSDNFFVWSRWVATELNHKENTWDPNKGSSNK